MVDIVYPNVAMGTPNHPFEIIWKLSRAIKKAGGTYLSSSDGSAKDTTGVATNDKWGGNADPSAESYPTGLDSVAAWWNGLIITTHKLSCNTSPGTFTPGEKVTQTGTGAEGEIKGFDFDGTANNTTVAAGSDGVDISTFAGAGTLNVVSATSFPSAGNIAIPALSAIISYTGTTGTTFTGCTTVSGSGVLATGQIVNGATGHAVIFPRTGSFNGTGVITGAISGATMTPTAIESYVKEIVLFKTTNTTQGSWYIQQVAAGAENTSRFSYLAANAAGCTATVAPGAGGTGNGFPTIGSYVHCGSQTGSPVHSNWMQVATNLGKSQIVCTNLTGATGVSPDATFWILMGDTSSATQAEFLGLFQLDDSEDGDLDPFVTYKGTSVSSANANIRLDGTGTTQLILNTFLTITATTTTGWKGWRRRGFPSADTFIPLTSANLAYGNGGPVLGDNLANPETVACSYSTKRKEEKLWLVSADNTKKITKGTIRHITLVQGNTTFDTFDNRTKIVILPGTSAGGTPLVGRYDGASTPAQS